MKVTFIDINLPRAGAGFSGRKETNNMLDGKQKAILKAYGKAQLTLKSHAVVSYDCVNTDLGYLVLPCDELWTSWRCRRKDHEVISWMHPHTQPYWDEYDILEDDFSEYMHKRFSILYKQEKFL